MRKFLALSVVVLVTILLVAVVVMWGRPPEEMSFTDARARAVASTSECAAKGTVGANGTYNDASNTWWFDFTPLPEFAQPLCTPACVVDATTGAVEIHWRCTGAVEPARYDDLLQVDSPLIDADVTSPLTVTGKARGTWYFEASFPVKLYDANNVLIAQVPAQAQGDWMTEEYVPFSATLMFSADTPTGTLVLENDNPSGLPENQKELRIPVTFVNAFTSEGYVTQNGPDQTPGVWYLVYERSGSPALSVALDFSANPTAASTLGVGDRVSVTGTLRDATVVVQSLREIPSDSMSIRLYYYNPALDQGPGGVQCSQRGLVAVDRVIPKTQTPLKDTITLLLRGELTSEEKAQGITTEFPLSGVRLTKATIVDGLATLTFEDPEHATGGGACRVGILWNQIQATAMQFPSVTSVRFLPEELFQP